MFKAGIALTFVVFTISACHVPPGGGLSRGRGVYQSAPPPVALRQPAPAAYSRVGWQRGGPPPWAPAHGYRRKQAQRYAYVQPYGIGNSACYREDLGRALGGITGAVVGTQVGKGGGKIAAVVGGTIIGVLIGGHIGRSMDDIDQNCIGQVLEHAQPNQPIAWNNPQSGGQYQVTPQQPYNDQQGRYCREYQTTATVGGQPQQTYGKACRQPDGSWQIVN